ncbi:putative nucleotidyltransferase with HDIG domain [Pseudoxanthomonas japonensis]|uniref:HD-GYP domain-containing protein n=1 Tax=Pseudoxanthomonas japonensis TaxID=69284 RepID=UPI00285D43E6|nr:HD-GYP domain-containing protein [Pseudoxanthomonas japonensis]MDR7068990.1 putative nucleotidyltransferase with HDIG domain [Pseudoxanthomonas japonensis]
MLQTVDVAELRPGMYVHKLLGPWMQHPFWRTSFLLDADRVAELQDSGVEQVVVDLSRSELDTDEVATRSAGETGQAEADRVSTPVAEAETERRRIIVADPAVSLASELSRARRICDEGRDAVEAMFREVRLGRGVDAGHVMPLLDEITGSIDRHPTALVSVARLKDADSYTYLHSVAVSALMAMLAKQLQLPDDQVREAAFGGLLHDMGKAMLPVEVLNKPGKLTEEEFAIVRQHPVHGERLLRDGGITQEAILHIARHHHEKVNGAGYPQRLSGAELPLLTRMSAICDVYDAITSNRPYKAGWDPAESLRRMASWQGHFDETLMKSFVRSIGIYPVGALVRLSSERLAVVVEQNPGTLLAPRVRVFYSAKLRKHVLMTDLDLATAGDHERIVGVESPEKWGFRELEKLWLP